MRVWNGVLKNERLNWQTPTNGSSRRSWNARKPICASRNCRTNSSHAARLTAAGQMAAALAHELNQPLTAVVNSVNAAKRLFDSRGTRQLLIAQEVIEEAAEQALRASEIVRSLRQLVPGTKRKDE